MNHQAQTEAVDDARIFGQCVAMASFSSVVVRGSRGNQIHRHAGRKSVGSCPSPGRGGGRVESPSGHATDQNPETIHTVELVCSLCGPGRREATHRRVVDKERTDNFPVTWKLSTPGEC